MKNDTDKISKAKALIDQIFNNVIIRIPKQKENNKEEMRLDIKEIEKFSSAQIQSKLIKDSTSEIQSDKYLVENFLDEIFSNKINKRVTLIELNHDARISQDPTSEIEINNKIKENIIPNLNKNSNLKSHEREYSQDIVDLNFVVKKEVSQNEKISLKRQQTEMMKNNFDDESSISDASVNITGELKSVYSEGAKEDFEIESVNPKQQHVQETKKKSVEFEENIRIANEESKSNTIVHAHNNQSVYKEVNVDRRNSTSVEEKKENILQSNDLLGIGRYDMPTVEENENIEIPKRKDCASNNVRKNSLIHKINITENKIKEEIKQIEKFNSESEAKKKDLETVIDNKVNLDKVRDSPLKQKLIVKKIKIVNKSIPTVAAVTNQQNEINILKEKLKVAKPRTTFLNQETGFKSEKFNQEIQVLYAPYMKENLTKQHRDIYRIPNTNKKDRNEPFDYLKNNIEEDFSKKSNAQIRNKTAKEYNKSIYSEQQIHPSPIQKKEKRGLSTRQKKTQEDDRKTLVLYENISKINSINDPNNPYSAHWANRILLKQYKVGITVGRFYNGVPIMKLKKKENNLLPNLMMKKIVDNFDIVRESVEIEFNTNRKNFFKARKDIEEDPNEYEMRESMDGNGDIQFPIIYNYLK